MSKMNLCAIFSCVLCFLVGCGQVESELEKIAEKKLDSVENAETLTLDKIGWNDNEKCFYSWHVCDKNDEEILLLFEALNECASFIECKIESVDGKKISTAKLVGLNFTTVKPDDETMTLTVADGQTQLYTRIAQDNKRRIKSTVSVKQLIALLEERGLKLKVALYAEDKNEKAVLIALIPKRR